MSGFAPELLERLSLGWRPWLVLGILCLGLYLPGIAALPPTDRDEARFMQASRQMAESGDLIQIRFQDEARNKKPAGIYWLQSAAVTLLSRPSSTAAWPYRLPSTLGAILAVLLTFGLAARWLGRPAALLGAVLLACSGMLVTEAHLAKTDAALLATVAAAQGALGEIYRRGRAELPVSRGLALVFWFAQGLGILLKGPMTPLIAVLTIVALAVADTRWRRLYGRHAERDLSPVGLMTPLRAVFKAAALDVADSPRRWLRGLHWSWGILLVILIVGPWFIAIESATGGGFAEEALGHDLLGKLLGVQESHGAPPGAYLLLAPLTFWPSSFALGAALVAGWRHRRETAERFLLAWLIPSWVVFELIPTKLPHYVLPLYPALALLAGKALLDSERLRWLDNAVFAVWSLIGTALLAGLVALPMIWGAGASAISILPAAAIVGFAIALLRRLGDGLRSVAAAIAAALSLCVFSPSFAILLPGLETPWLSRSAAAMVARHPAADAAGIDAVGYNEPSLVFLLGGRVRGVAAEQAAADLAAHPGSLALVASSEDERFRRALDQRGAHAVKLDETHGIDYSRSGRAIKLTLYTAEPA